jgi:3'-phosphoadenosine 5'-phosphosulfate sulfotransferase (PAPS reductase)/FAD synthetase
MKYITWWSGGITSALVCKYAIESHDATPIFIETGSHHDDNLRFKKDCEMWYGKEILQVQNDKFRDHFEVIEKMRYLNGVAGARCTSVLKRMMREKVQKQYHDIVGYFWGFEYGKKEQNRADRVKETIPEYEHYFPLIEKRIDKKKAITIVKDAGIEIPTMYKLGFPNANCIGCVKGGKGYWNLVRKTFPEHFNRMVELESNIGRSCINGTFLKDLDPNAGRNQISLDDCGATGEYCTTRESKEINKV